MKVSEAVGEVSHKTNLETQTYVSQVDPLFSQDSAKDDWLNHKILLYDDTEEHTICRDMNQRIHSLSDAEPKNSQELNLCTDKGVIEVSPKLVCCFKEGYHNIKDICIDEGFPVNEKCLIGHSETSKENPPSLLKFKVNELGDRCTGGVRTGGYDLNDFSVDFKEKHNDHNMRFFLPKSEPIYDDDVDKLVIGGWPGPIKYIAYEKLLSTKTSEVPVNKNFEKPAVVDIDKGAEKEEHHQDEGQEKIIETQASTENSNRDSDKEGSPLSSTDTTQSGDLLLNSETQKLTETTGKSVEEDNECKDGCQVDGVPKSALEHGAGGPSSLGASFRSFVHGMDGSDMKNSSTNHADVSGQLRNSVSASIMHSGRFASMSLRSDSSTASARSFAFPILPSEWNASPVKMAKADRRRLRKHRGWLRMLLLCYRS